MNWIGPDLPCLLVRNAGSPGGTAKRICSNVFRSALTLLAALLLLGSVGPVAAFQEDGPGDGEDQEMVAPSELDSEAEAPAAEGGPSKAIFRDVRYDRLPPEWSRTELRPEAGKAPTSVQWSGRDGVHDLRLTLFVGTITPRGRVLTRSEIASALASELRAQLPSSYQTREGERVVAGGRYPTVMGRSEPAPGVGTDLLTLVYVPDDYSQRGRFYTVTSLDTHSASVPAREPTELDGLLAGLDLMSLGTVLAADDFEEAGRGLIRPRDDASGFVQGYENGEYVIRKVDLAATALRLGPLPGSYADASIAADARLASDRGNPGLYLYCRRFGTPSSGYRLSLQPIQRTFTLQRLNGSQPTTNLVTSRQSDEIQGGGETNRIELSCSGSAISVRINGVQQTSVQDDTYGYGELAIAANSLANIPLDARFDNLEVRVQ